MIKNILNNLEGIVKIYLSIGLFFLLIEIFAFFYIGSKVSDKMQLVANLDKSNLTISSYISTLSAEWSFLTNPHRINCMVDIHISNLDYQTPVQVAGVMEKKIVASFSDNFAKKW